MLHVVFSLLHVAKQHAASDLRCILHLAWVACCVSCCLFLHVASLLHGARFACCMPSVACCLCRVACCQLHPVRFAIIAAHWDSRCILHLSCCASHGVLTACLPRAAAAAPTDDGALAHARGAWVGTYPITVVPTSPKTASPTNAGKRCRYVRMRSAWRCSTSTGTHPLPHPSAA